MLSAAALRRRLLERQASAPATPTPSREDNEGLSKESGDEETKPKRGAMSPVKKDSPRTAEQVLLGNSGAATTEDDLYGTPESQVLEDPPKRKLLQLSSFKPNKGNLQIRPDGVAILRFADAEVYTLSRNHLKLRIVQTDWK